MLRAKISQLKALGALLNVNVFLLLMLFAKELKHMPC